MKKKLAAILALLQLCALLAACSQEKEPGDTSAPDTAAQPDSVSEAVETEPLTEAERRALVPDDLPEQTYGGAKFTIITLNNRTNLYYAEDLTGVAVNDAIYERNETVQSRFDVKIGVLGYADRLSCRAAIQQAIRGGDADMFDLVAYHLADNGANAVAGLYQNWYDIPHVNFEKPWWSDSNVEDLTINGKCFIALGDVNITSVRNIWCYVFNKQLAADNKLEDLYDLVRKGEWTIDKVREIAEAVYVDTNADGVPNRGDTFGLGSYQGSAMNTYLWAFDNPIIKKDDQGVPQYVLNTEKLPDIVTTVVDLYNHVNGVYSSRGADTTSETGVINNGNNLMMTPSLSYLTLMAGEVEFEVGVLPYPKYNQEQDAYYTMVDGGGDSMGVSIVSKDVEYIGTITEALCAESYKQIYPVYYDIMLKNRYAVRPDDAEMMDILVAGRVYDLGYIYDNWMGAGFWMQNLVTSGNTAVASFYASKWPAAQKYYNKVLSIFED